MYTHDIAHERLAALADLINQLADKIKNEPICTVLVWRDRVAHLRGLAVALDDEAKMFAVYCRKNEPCAGLLVSFSSLNLSLSFLAIELEKIGLEIEGGGKLEFFDLDKKVDEQFLN